MFSRSLIWIFTGRILDSQGCKDHADKEDLDQTVRMHRVIWVFVVRTSKGTFSHVTAHLFLQWELYVYKQMNGHWPWRHSGNTNISVLGMGIPCYVMVSKQSLSIPMGLDNYREFGWDTEVNPFLTHNISLTSCLLFTTKTQDWLENCIEYNRITFIGTSTCTEGVLHSPALFRHTRLMQLFLNVIIVALYQMLWNIH